MKKILLTAILFFVFFGISNAKTVTLSWDASPSNVAGYKVYYNIDNPSPPFNGMGAFEGSSPIDVGNVLSFELNSLQNNDKIYFAVTAYDDEGNESTYSNVVASNPVVPDLDSSWEASDGIMLTSENLVSVEVQAPEQKYLKKFEGVVVKGEVTSLKLNAHFNGSTIAYVYAKDQGTGKIISSQSAIFIDEDYGSHDVSVVYTTDSTEAELYIDFGYDVGNYEFQKMVVSTTEPEFPPVEDFWLSHMSEASIEGAVFDDNWEWTPPTPSPDSYRVVIAKTLKGVMGQEPESLYVDMPIQNVGQSTLENLTVTLDLELNGYFIALSALYGEKESVPIIKAHLPGNLIGTADDENPSLFKDINIDNNDVHSVYTFYRTRANVGIPGGEPASAEERASAANRPYVIRFDYSYTRGRMVQYRELQMEAPHW